MGRLGLQDHSQNCFYIRSIFFQFIQCNRDTEIVSLVGTLSRESQPHLHISLSDETGKVIGGHLPSSGGAIVRTTAEVVLGASSDLVFTRKYDEETGFDELVVGQ